MKKETENKQVFSFKKGHTLPMSDESFDFLENCQKALMIGNLRGMIVDNNDDGKPSFFQTTGIGDKKAKMAFTFYKRFSDINKFTHFLVHEDDLQYYKDFIENFALETGQVFTHRLRGKSTEYKIAFIPPIVDQNVKSSINIGDEYLKDLKTLSSFDVGSDEQDKQIKYMLQKYVAICLNYTDGKLNEVYTDHGNITVIVYKDNKMFTNVYSKVNKITGEKIEFRDFDNVPKMFNDRINGFKGKKTMTYDFILMNPPYDKNLHLKIVEQSINLLTDEGILVNLSPIRWLQDPLAKYKKTSDYCKFEESVAKHIERLVSISSFQAKDFFGIGIDQDLGIYVIRRSHCDFQISDNTIISKVMNNKHIRVGLPYKSYKDKSCNNFFPIRRAGSGKKRNPVYDTTVLGNKDYYGVFDNGVYNGMSFEEAKKSNHRSVNGDISNMNIIESNNLEELFNVYESLDTVFIRYLTFKMTTGIDLPINYLPWMGECINPRTRLKGYEGEWTDEDFRKYFNITDIEWEEIERVMKPYL